MNCGVYLIRNMKNGKVYVGSSIDINRRWIQHISSLETGNHNNPHLQRAWQKYGKDAFEFTILQLTDNHELISIEQNYIDQFEACDIRKGYNICPHAGSSLGRKMPTGFQTGHKNHRYGITFTDETKKKISKALKDRIPSTESIDKMRNTLTGRKLSDEHCKSISEGHKGKKLSEETKSKIGRGNRGKVRSEDCKEKISQKNKGRKHSVVAKEKMSASRKGLKNNCKISGDKVPVILRMLETQLVKEVAKVFNVSIGTIYLIKNGKRE